MVDILVPADDGHWISEAHARISELIQEYDPSFELVWIPPEKRGNERFPYAVRHNSPLGSYIAFYIEEGQLDHRVLARIYRGDLSKHDVLADIEASDKAKRDIRNRELAERAEARKDFIKSVVTSRKHNFKHNGKVYPT